MIYKKVTYNGILVAYSSMNHSWPLHYSNWLWKEKNGRFLKAFSVNIFPRSHSHCKFSLMGDKSMPCIRPLPINICGMSVVMVKLQKLPLSSRFITKHGTKIILKPWVNISFGERFCRCATRLCIVSSKQLAVIPFYSEVNM